AAPVAVRAAVWAAAIGLHRDRVVEELALFIDERDRAGQKPRCNRIEILDPRLVLGGDDLTTRVAERDAADIGQVVLRSPGEVGAQQIRECDLALSIDDDVDVRIQTKNAL